MKYYKCLNCEGTQAETEFGECAECGYEDLQEVNEKEYNRLNEGR